MAGIYIHIPFCKSRCFYCDFHSGTNLPTKEKLLTAICHEIIIRKDYLEGEPIETIYIGGGTPSLLNFDELSTILTTIYQTFDTSQLAEITLEANPDDITTEYAGMLNNLRFNRISIGIQSFNNEELILINRRHSAEKAIQSVNICKSNGFNNISIDLIYGLPGQQLKSWKNNLMKALELDIQHISAYHLTYETGTKMTQLLNAKKIKPVTEDTSFEMFKRLTEITEQNGFEQYEISNFAKEGFRSKHNSSYWNNKKYLGIGPSAHSYDLNSRQWNKCNTEEYIYHINNKTVFFEKEELSAEEKYNDFVITRLRTKEGINLDTLKNMGEKFYQYSLKNANSWIKNNILVIEDNHLRLTKEGIFISDRVFSDLICV
jgi:oxygen-independent coproporphyrinogen-3 oxidase